MLFFYLSDLKLNEGKVGFFLLFEDFCAKLAVANPKANVVQAGRLTICSFLKVVPN